MPVLYPLPPLSSIVSEQHHMNNMDSTMSQSNLSYKDLHNTLKIQRY